MPRGSEFVFLGREIVPAYGAGGNIPEGSEFSAVGITLGQPFVPGGEFDGIAVGACFPEVLRDAGLVDEIPSEIGHVVKAGDDGRDQGLLAANGLGIEVGIRASENVGKEMRRS